MNEDYVYEPDFLGDACGRALACLMGLTAGTTQETSALADLGNLLSEAGRCVPYFFQHLYAASSDDMDVAEHWEEARQSVALVIDLLRAESLPDRDRRAFLSQQIEHIQRRLEVTQADLLPGPQSRFLYQEKVTNGYRCQCCGSAWWSPLDAYDASATEAGPRARLDALAQQVRNGLHPDLEAIQVFDALKGEVVAFAEISWPPKRGEYRAWTALEGHWRNEPVSARTESLNPPA